MSAIGIVAGVIALVLLIVQQCRLATLRQNRQAAREAEGCRHFAQELIEAIPCPVFYKGVDGRYMGCNSAFTEYLGKSRGEIVGHTVYDIAPKELADSYAAADAALFGQAGTQVYEVRVQWADGSLRDVVMNKATFSRADSALGGLIGVIVDITERKRAETLVIQMKDELEQRVLDRTSELKAANKELEEFSYSMSHDMRTPLRAISGYSKILLDEHGSRLDDEGRRLLEAVRKNAARMGRLIDDILRFLDLARTPAKPVAVDVAALAREAFSALAAGKPERCGRLEVGALPLAWADQEMVRRLLRELLENSWKYACSGRELVIEIGGAENGAENVYYAKDNGVGFDMRYAHKLFKVFQRVHPTDQYGGSGVGLALAKLIAEKHGGRVWAEGAVGEGATVHFTMPAAGKR